jgi:dihydropteroate synthase
VSLRYLDSSARGKLTFTMLPRKVFRLKLPSRTLVLGERTLLMGVLNVTPDSFSDGGKFLALRKAVSAALAMQDAGADILDIGAESTRPGSLGISTSKELERLLPVLEALRGRLKIPISIDTQKSAVAELAIGAGAEMFNDVSGLMHDPHLAQIAARHKIPLFLMHMRGTPSTMQKLDFAKNVLLDVITGLRRSLVVACRAGVRKSQIVLDPGIGFGKSYAQNYELLAKLPALAKLGCPILVGTSRKGFLGATLAQKGKSLPPDQRIWGSAATITASILLGAHIVRIHDVAEMAQVCKVTDEIMQALRKA